MHNTIPERKNETSTSANIFYDQETYFTRKKHHHFVPELFVCAVRQVGNGEGKKNQAIVIKES